MLTTSYALKHWLCEPLYSNTRKGFDRQRNLVSRLVSLINKDQNTQDPQDQEKKEYIVTQNTGYPLKRVQRYFLPLLPV